MVGNKTLKNLKIPASPTLKTNSCCELPGVDHHHVYKCYLKKKRNLYANVGHRDKEAPTPAFRNCSSVRRLIWVVMYEKIEDLLIRKKPICISCTKAFPPMAVAQSKNNCTLATAVVRNGIFSRFQGRCRICEDGQNSSFGRGRIWYVGRSAKYKHTNWGLYPWCATFYDRAGAQKWKLVPIL